MYQTQGFGIKTWRFFNVGFNDCGLCILFLVSSVCNWLEIRNFYFLFLS